MCIFKGWTSFLTLKVYLLNNGKNEMKPIDSIKKGELHLEGCGKNEVIK